MHKPGLVVLVAWGAVGLATACGGASKSDAFTEPGGGSPPDGNPSHAGSTSAEAGEGPATGGTSSATGGSTGTGGKASGGTAGTGAFPLPDPAVREACDGWCEGLIGPACNDDTLADCLLGCRATANSPACNAAYGKLFECAEDATFTCNDDGDAVPQGCEVEYASAGLCVLGNPDTTIEAPCQSFCAAAEAADCMNSDPAADCTYGCQLNSALIPACTQDWRTFIGCAAEAEVTCNETGDAVPAACGADYLRYVACVLDAGQ